MSFVADLKFAFRSFTRAKGLALTVIVTLALGIGANAAMFSVVRVVLLRPLVNRDESRLIYIRQSAPGIDVENTTFSIPELIDLRSGMKTVTAFGDFSTINFTMVGLGEPRVVRAGVVGGSYFDVMGLRPVLGRLIEATDDGPNAAGVAVLTHRFWTTGVGSDPNVIGKTVRLGVRSATIIGILEPSVPYPEETEIIANVVTSPHHMSATMVTGRAHRMTELFGRLAPGADLEAPGVLQKEWRQEGRRYFHYKTEEPILPNLSFCSARYEIARDRWKDVALEIYYDPKHPFNIAAMIETAKRGLEMYSTEFAAYLYSYLRILESPSYRSVGKFHSGTVPLSEAVGFVNDLRALENADYGVMHELAHMWWGERITGAQMQGRWMLTENMADYSTLMLFREYYPPVFANRIARGMLDGYLNGRSQENEAELPVMYTERHGYLRAKGPLALYALQDIIGKEKVHQALRNFLDDYSFQTAPCPTSRDLVNAPRAEAGPEYQELITDLFERIVLYDLQVDAASAREIDGGYEVTIEVTVRQFEANGSGEEAEVPLDTWFDVALFPETKEALEGVTPLYIEKHRLRSGNQILTVRTTERPGIVTLDPFHKKIERSAGNNSGVIAVLPIRGSRSLR